MAFWGGPIAGWLGAELGNRASRVEEELDQETCRDFPIRQHRSETTTRALFEDDGSCIVSPEKMVTGSPQEPGRGEGLAGTTRQPWDGPCRLRGQHHHREGRGDQPGYAGRGVQQPTLG